MKASVKLLALASLLMIWSCSKTNDNNPDPTINKTEQVSGDWVVTRYFDSGKDETNNYSGYSFIFTVDGNLSANAASGNFSGSWRLGDSSPDDDNSSNRFVITISGNKQMDDLTDDWLIVSISETEISLKDDNPSSMEELKFSRKNQ